MRRFHRCKMIQYQCIELTQFFISQFELVQLSLLKIITIFPSLSPSRTVVSGELPRSLPPCTARASFHMRATLTCLTLRSSFEPADHADLALHLNSLTSCSVPSNCPSTFLHIETSVCVSPFSHKFIYTTMRREHRWVSNCQCDNRSTYEV